MRDVQQVVNRPTPRPPDRDRIGPYRILDTLGAGGMGSVYRGYHVDTATTAAVKCVRLTRQDLLERLRREIEALARLRHPGIVSLLHRGLEHGVPWYAMELLEGATLRQWARCNGSAAMRPGLSETVAGTQPDPNANDDEGTGWWTTALSTSTEAAAWPASNGLKGLLRPARHTVLSPVELRRRLRLVHRLCGTLAYLHGEGLVHRDLKPDNVLVREGDVPVIVDFGMVLQTREQESPTGGLSREKLVADRGAIGTVRYMAPELIRGQTVDARADLYAVGCILYELLAGRTPFDGDHATVLSRHLYAKPLPPSRLVPAVPSAVDRLVLRLLAKEPKDRLGYATDVQAALEAIGVEGSSWSEAPPPRDYLYRPEVEGREAELDDLGRCLDRTRQGAGSCVLLSGESGVGKTRLATEIASIALQDKWRVLVGACVEHGGAALQALRRPLRQIADTCIEGGLEMTERLLGARGPVLAQYEPALRDLPGQAVYPAPAELPVRSAQLRLHRYLTETVAALAESQPLLILLDDLQWADELTLGWLEHLGRTGALGSLSVQVVCTARTEMMTPVLDRIVDRGGVRRLVLERLDEDAVGRTAASMLALSSPPTVFADFLYRNSEGNPFFVAEYLRLAVEEGALWRDRGGRWHVGRDEGGPATAADFEALPLPRSIRCVVEGRLERLPVEARRLVEIAAVAGDSSGTRLLARIAGMDRAMLEKRIGELERTQMLESADSGSLAFIHDKFREIVYDALPADHRCAMHGRVAAGLEALYNGERAAHAVQLAYHWQQAGEAAAARSYYLVAARAAVMRYAHEEAERLYRAYLALVDGPSAESIAARIELGNRVLHQTGRVKEAESELLTAHDEARVAGDRSAEAASLVTLGRALIDTGRTSEAAALLEQGLAIQRELGNRKGEGIALAGLAVLHKEQGRLEEAGDLCQQALAIHREMGNRREEGGSLGNLANLRKHQGRLEEALVLYERALVVQRAVGDRRSVGITLGNIAGLRKMQGRLEEAREFHERALAVKREVGDRRGEGNTEGNLAMVHHDLGKPGEALERCERALAIFREVDDRSSEGWILDSMSRITILAGGELGRARELNRQAQALLREVGDVYRLAIAWCTSGHVALASGESAAAAMREATALIEELQAGPTTDPGVALAMVCNAEGAWEAGLSHRLVHGHRVDDLTPGQLAWLIESGFLAAC